MRFAMSADDTATDSFATTGIKAGLRDQGGAYARNRSGTISRKLFNTQCFTHIMTDLERVMATGWPPVPALTTQSLGY
jgi:hypothetical protein